VNDFPPSIPLYNPMELFFHPGSETSTYGAVEGRQGSMNYRLSASIGHQGGVVRYDEGSKNKSFRMNLDSKIRSDLSVSFSGYFANVWQDLVDQGGGGILDNLSQLNPVYNLLEIDPVDGDLKASVGPPGNETTNILYTLKTETRNARSQPVHGRAHLHVHALLVADARGERELRPVRSSREFPAAEGLQAQTMPMAMRSPRRGVDEPVERRGRGEECERHRVAELQAGRLHQPEQTALSLRGPERGRVERFGKLVCGHRSPQLGLLTGTPSINSSNNRTVAEAISGSPRSGTRASTWWTSCSA
jgi:hypothetical protein